MSEIPLVFTKAPWWPEFSANMKREGREWHGPCPRCGGTRRFWLCYPGATNTKKTFAHCRVCGYNWFPDDEKTPEPISNAEPLKPLPTISFDEARRKAERMLPALQKAALTPQGLKAWAEAGVSEELVRQWGLGFKPKAGIAIPHFWRNPEGEGRMLWTLLIRHDDEENGKYRPIVRGLRPIFWWNQVFSHRLAIVEGAKKAMTMSIMLEHQAMVLGLYTARIISRERAELSQLARTYPIRKILYIPDPYTATTENALQFQQRVYARNIVDLRSIFPRAKIIALKPDDLEDKFDDMLIDGRLTKDELFKIIRQAATR